MIKTTGSFANDIFGVNIMIINNRRGVIGFMLTMAVGIALGAATLVVTSEMTRDDNKKKTTLSSARTLLHRLPLKRLSRSIRKPIRNTSRPPVLVAKMLKNTLMLLKKPNVISKLKFCAIPRESRKWTSASSKKVMKPQQKLLLPL